MIDPITAAAERLQFQRDRRLALVALELALGSIVRVCGIDEARRVLAEYQRQLEEY